jgi:antitoxin component HigA of HigAB toxin-antitoxin module
METKTSINQRFIKAIDFLIQQKLVKNKTELAQNLKISKSKFSEILNERMNVGIDIIALFCLIYKINSDWLITGVGDIVKVSDKKNNETINLLIKENESLKETNDLLRFKITTLEDKIINQDKSTIKLPENITK